MIVTRDGEQMYVYTGTDRGRSERPSGSSPRCSPTTGSTAAIRRRRWNPSERFWQDADEPLSETTTPPRPTTRARPSKEGVPHPLFVYIEDHEPEFMRDLGS